ncbi:hypothetical protein [Streptomyces sp. NPDC090994]|uniref:hypothetical protein n=1 Tax=Streptomyces sp. NPDC090994 TaxID=3365969 RepID=UPI00382B3B33
MRRSRSDQAAVFIGQGATTPSLRTTADACRRLHTERAEAESAVQDLPDDCLERGVADKFVES